MFSLLLSLVVQAQEIRLPIVQGDYQVSENVEVLSQVRWIDFPSETSASNDKVLELESQGYSCNPLSSAMIRCYRKISPTLATPQLLEATQKKWGQDVFTFYRQIADASMVVNTEFFRQWSVPQKVVRWKISHQEVNELWNPVTYTWGTGDLWQVYLGSPQSEVYIPIVIGDDQLLSVSDSLEFKNDEWHERFQLRLRLEKVEL